MSPSGYIQSRQLAASDPSRIFTATLVDNRPYLPNLTVDASDETSICLAAVAVVLLNAGRTDDADYPSANHGNFKVLHVDIDWEVIKQNIKCLSCVKVTGGITNALYRVSGFQTLLQSECVQQTLTLMHSSNEVSASLNVSKPVDFDSVLIRIFGAEGMINRDIETSTYAALCRADIAHLYLGRFQNGRLEGWLDGYKALKCDDLQCSRTSMSIARAMARLHCLFEVPAGELRDHHGSEVGLWDQLKSWMEQAIGYTEFKTKRDTDRVKTLELVKIECEVNRIIDFYTKDSTTVSDGIVFCHNDMLAANIMRDPQTNKIQLIDFEYGGTNFIAFDIANHFNEHAGGTTAEEDATPDYDKFPKQERQQMFCTEYVKMVKELEKQKNGSKEDNAHNIHREAMDLLDQVKEFVLINHLYWGLWAVNQAAEEGCDDFDYITYATNRFNEFYKRKSEWESEK